MPHRYVLLWLLQEHACRRIKNLEVRGKTGGSVKQHYSIERAAPSAPAGAIAHAGCFRGAKGGGGGDTYTNQNCALGVRG